MEHTENNTHFEEFEALHLTALSRDYLVSAGKWARILAILGFIGMAFVILAGFLFIFASSLMPLGDVPMPFPLSYFGIFYFIMGALYLFPLLSLWRFAQKTDIAVSRKDTGSLEEGLMNLRGFFRYIGIFSLAIIGLYILMIIGMGIFGALA